jgi:hypothetical protein
VLAIREVTTCARRGAHQGSAKVVRLVDWRAFSRPDRQPNNCTKLLILQGIFGSSSTVDQVLQQYSREGLVPQANLHCPSQGGNTSVRQLGRSELGPLAEATRV